MAEPAIELQHVSALIREGYGLDDLSLTVLRGEAVALVGANGSGKSLALRIAAGLETPDSGTVRLLGVDPAGLSEEQYVGLRRRVGFVFEKPALISNMTAFNNVALPLRYHTAMTDDEIRDRVMTALSEWGVEQSAGRFPVELTLGDARLVAIARAVALKPEILFIEEMLYALDAEGLSRVGDYVEHSRAKTGLTVLATVNAPTRLLELMDRVALLRDGRLKAFGTLAEAERLEDPTFRAFFEMN